MIKLVISAYPISKLNIPNETIIFNIDNDEWPDLATNIKEKATFLYMSIVANSLNYYNTQESMEVYSDDAITEIYNNLDDKNYEDILKFTLDKYNISYEIDNSEEDVFSEDYSEFIYEQSYLSEYDFYNPKVLHTIMKDDISLLNFLFSDESGLYNI